jgi:hypothetical protein
MNESGGIRELNYTFLNEEINETAVYILLKSDFNRIGEGF